VRRLVLLALLALPLPLAAGLPLALSAAAQPDGPGERAHAMVRLLASFGPRPAGSVNESRAGDIIASRLRAFGWDVSEQPFALPRGGVSRNVVARSAGPARVVLVAHVDGVSAGPAANDNGSGVAVLLELAGVLRGTRGVVLAATGAEERVQTRSRTHLGAARLLRSLSATDRASVRFAAALDMLGVGPAMTVRGPEPAPNRSAAALLSAAQRVGARAYYLRDRGESDHAELTRGGVPAAWLEWREDPCWHAACDRARRVDPVRLRVSYETVLAAVLRALAR
jgi:aminopeptidase S